MRKSSALIGALIALSVLLPGMARAEGADAPVAPADAQPVGARADDREPASDAASHTPLFSGGGQSLRGEVGIGAPYALIGVNVEYAPFRYGSVFFGFTGVRDAFFGITGGVRAYPFGNDNGVNVYGQGFAGFIGLSTGNNQWDEDSVYGVSYYGAGGGLEFRFDRWYRLRLGLDWVHAEDQNLTLPTIGVSREM